MLLPVLYMLLGDQLKKSWLPSSIPCGDMHHGSIGSHKDLSRLVVSNMFLFFYNIWDNPSHCLSYFSRWLKPTNQMFPLVHLSSSSPQMGFVKHCGKRWISSVRRFFTRREWDIDLPSDKHTTNYGKSPFLIGKSTN